MAESNVPWYKQLQGYHWFVFIMASLAWLFDCLDQQLFILARNGAMSALLPKGWDPKEFGGYSTALFVAGWATGGLIFGSLGDRFGRARMLMVTVLMYSVCTGLSALSKGFADFAFYRFVTGVGVGGVFGLAVALVADTVPAGARAGALGTLQALSAVGNVMAGIIGLLLAEMDPKESWKYMFLIGAAPAFLCVFLQAKLKEPQKWIEAKELSKKDVSKAMGSYGSLFGDARWRRSALLGMMLCVAGVVGLWGIGFFSPELVGPVIEKSLVADGMDVALAAKQKGKYISYNMIVQNIGAFLGMLSMTAVAARIGRKTAFAVSFIGALIVTVLFFQKFNGVGDMWMTFLMGFFQLGIFAGFAIYLPELFPLRLRSTGVSFCYNVGRFIAATGPFTLGALGAALAKKAGDNPLAKLQAFRDTCSYMSIIFLLGLVALWFLPETKDRPLPED
jgi:MFS family permease